jgi:aerobic-type carbon monoxide dehydrogenase small subunit (CoxS/CutS family)
MFYSCGMNLSVNDKIVSIPDAQASEPLVWVLRDTLGLVGTRYGCGIGVCGTCNLLLDGVVTRACQTPAQAAVGKSIITLEGLAQGENLHPVQQAFLENPLQCCWCMTGHIMNAVELLEQNPKPNPEQIDTAMNDNYCRCGGYNTIRSNVTRASEIYATQPATQRIQIRRKA